MKTLPNIRYSEHLQYDDDIFITFQKINSADNFYRNIIDIPFGFYCSSEYCEQWEYLDLFVEHALFNCDAFNFAMDLFRSHGFIGAIKLIDNIEFQEKKISEGACILFRPKLIYDRKDKYNIYSCTMALHVYENKVQRSHDVECVINEIRQFVSDQSSV